MNKAITFRLLTIISILLLVVIYFSPIWWVKLDEVPAYPDGVPINFHINGIFNGTPVTEGKLCDKLMYWVHEMDVLNYLNGMPINFHINGIFNGSPFTEGELCDKLMYWVHKMDVLNYFLGMYPTGTPAPIERALSPFLFAFLILLLLVFMISERRFQATVFTVGFGIIVVWAYVALFTPGGLSLLSKGYQQFVQCDMDVEPSEIQKWSGFYAMQESYYASLSQTTQSRAKNKQMASSMTTTAYVVIEVLIVGALIFLVGLLWKNNLFYWLLVIIPILLPVFFILEYAGWQWWINHNLSDWASFSYIPPVNINIFGETVVLDGFVIHSYPHYGFGLMMLSSVLLIFAASLRRKQLRGIEKE